MSIFNKTRFIKSGSFFLLFMLSFTSFSHSQFFTLRKMLVVSGITLIVIYKLMDAKKNNVNHGQHCECELCAIESAICSEVS